MFGTFGKIKAWCYLFGLRHSQEYFTQTAELSVTVGGNRVFIAIRFVISYHISTKTSSRTHFVMLLTKYINEASEF